MRRDHSSFLYNVQKYVEENPEVAAYVLDFVAKGLQDKLSNTLERAADMEVALSVAIAKRWPKRENLILSKLKKWKDKSTLNWDSVIESLDGDKYAN